jgi:hypothetical protein
LAAWEALHPLDRAESLLSIVSYLSVVALSRRHKHAHFPWAIPIGLRMEAFLKETTMSIVRLSITTLVLLSFLAVCTAQEDPPALAPPGSTPADLIHRRTAGPHGGRRGTALKMKTLSDDLKPFADLPLPQQAAGHLLLEGKSARAVATALDVPIETVEAWNKTPQFLVLNDYKQWTERPPRYTDLPLTTRPDLIGDTRYTGSTVVDIIDTPQFAEQVQKEIKKDLGKQLKKAVTRSRGPRGTLPAHLLLEGKSSTAVARATQVSVAPLGAWHTTQRLHHDDYFAQWTGPHRKHYLTRTARPDIIPCPLDKLRPLSPDELIIARPRAPQRSIGLGALNAILFFHSLLELSYQFQRDFLGCHQIEDPVGNDMRLWSMARASLGDYNSTAPLHYRWFYGLLGLLLFGGFMAVIALLWRRYTWGPVALIVLAVSIVVHAMTPEVEEDVGFQLRDSYTTSELNCLAQTTHTQLISPTWLHGVTVVAERAISGAGSSADVPTAIRVSPRRTQGHGAGTPGDHLQGEQVILIEDILPCPAVAYTLMRIGGLSRITPSDASASLSVHGM